MKFPEQFRAQHPGNPLYETTPGCPFGCFIVPAHKAPGRRQLNIIAVDGEETEWEHVSVSLGQHSKTCPTWEEMCFVKDLFWKEDEWVIQFHPAREDYVNQHPGVLHLWCYTKIFPTPPKVCV